MPTKALPMAYDSAFIGRCKRYPKNDINTRIVNGEEIDEAFIPCNYVVRPLEEEAVA